MTGARQPPPRCLIIQPIHEAGEDALRSAGVTPVPAAASDEATILAAIGDCAAVITRSAGLSIAAMDAAPGLRVIGSHGIGTDAIPVAAATKRGITVVNTPTANSQSVAEHAIALMLALAKHLPAADHATRRGDFGFKYRAPSFELCGAILGLVGFGTIARRVAGLARGFGMEVVAISARQPESAFAASGVGRAADLAELFRRADIVSVHLPATPATERLIGGALFAAMKPQAIFINTSRGAVIDEAALIAGLHAGRPRWAGLDVYQSEAMDPAYALLALDSVLLTPHSAASSDAALRRMAIDVAAGVIDVLAGRPPLFPVNPEVRDSPTWAARAGSRML